MTRQQLVLIILVAMVSWGTSVSAEEPLWTTLIEKSDHLGKIEVDKRTVVRRGSKLQAWLRVTEPHSFPVVGSLGKQTRFTSQLVEVDCLSKTARYLRTLYLSRPDSKVPMFERGALESFELVSGSPMATTLQYLCASSSQAKAAGQ